MELEAAHANDDDDRYDKVSCSMSGQPPLDLPHQPRGCSIASTSAIRLGSANNLYSIATDYNGPLEAAHANDDDDRYDKVS